MSKVTAHARTQRHMALISKSKRGALTPSELEELEEFEAKYDGGGGVGEGGEALNIALEDFVEEATQLLMRGVLAALASWERNCSGNVMRKAKQASTTALDAFRMLEMLNEGGQGVGRLHRVVLQVPKEVLEEPLEHRRQLLATMRAMEKEIEEEESGGDNGRG